MPAQPLMLHEREEIRVGIERSRRGSRDSQKAGTDSLAPRGDHERRAVQHLLVRSLVATARSRFVDRSGDPAAEFSTRPTRLAWLYAGAGIGLLLGVNAWFKRSDIALYKTLGASPWQTASLFTLQGILLISAAWAVATPGLLLAHRSQIIDFPSAGSVSLRATALAAFAGAAAQSGFHVLAALGGTSDQIRQRI